MPRSPLQRQQRLEAAAAEAAAAEVAAVEAAVEAAAVEAAAAKVAAAEAAAAEATAAAEAAAEAVVSTLFCHSILRLRLTSCIFFAFAQCAGPAESVLASACDVRFEYQNRCSAHIHNYAILQHHLKYVAPIPLNEPAPLD